MTHACEWRAGALDTLKSDYVGGNYAIIDLRSATAICTIVRHRPASQPTEVLHTIANAGSLCATMQTAAHVLHALHQYGMRLP